MSVVIVALSDLDPGSFYVDPVTKKIKLVAQPSGGGESVDPQVFAINNVAQFAADHGLSYTPKCVLVDTTGEEVETDIDHIPGVAILTFAIPFTGKVTIY